LWVCKYGNAQSESATGYELNVIAAVVLGGVSISGGVGNVLGVFLGALIIGILNNILPLIQVSTYWQMAIRGAIIIISVIINALTQRNIQKRSLRKRA
jgi:rhamnose transport system permease protein